MSQESMSQESFDEQPTKLSCEVKVKRIVLVDGKKTDKHEYQWVLKRISDIPGKPKDVRCPYCHGPIRLAFQGRGLNSKADHFEHLGEKAGTTDRRTCRAGEGFQGGEHLMSSKRVE